MKITLELDRLIADQKITQEEADRLISLAVPSKRNGLISNIFMILGAIAVAAGVIALEPSATMGLMLAILSLGAGSALFFIKSDDWRILSHALIVMGCLGLAGWTAWQAAETWPENMNMVPQFVALGLFTGGAILFRQGFLAALAPLTVGTLIGSGTMYWHASYSIFVKESLITIIIFTLIAGGLYFIRDKLEEQWHSITTVAARVSFFMVNFAFWVGSLWGDYVGEIWASDDGWEARNAWRETAFQISEGVFSFGWALFLIICIWLGTKDHRRFLANTAATFLAIHFYTQLFDMFGAEPGIVVLAGFTMVGVAFGITRFDLWQKQRALQVN